MAATNVCPQALGQSEGEAREVGTPELSFKEENCPCTLGRGGRQESPDTERQEEDAPLGTRTSSAGLGQTTWVEKQRVGLKVS